MHLHQSPQTQPAPSSHPVSLETTPEELDPRIRDFYLRAMDLLDQAAIPFLVGGAYSMAYHANIVRHTKDFDVFVRHADHRFALDALAKGHYRTELTFPHWLGKAFDSNPYSDAFVDVIFGSGNGVCPVDDEWFHHAIDGESLGRPVKICPAEEVIWQKSFVQERERYDGADVAHLILARGKTLDWPRLLRRFRGRERVLLAQLILFEFIYPDDHECIPSGLVEHLFHGTRSPRVGQRDPAAGEKICRGALLSRAQYLIDLSERGYQDARLQPIGPMKEQDIAHWTAAINTIK